MSPCDPAAAFRGFGISTTCQLLDSAAQAMSDALKSPHPEAVHKMRVAIRRFQQSLRLFSKFLKKRGIREVRRELKSVMDPAGELRNLDIAIGLVRRAKADTSSLKERRVHARASFQEALGEIAHADPAERWRTMLELRRA